MQEDCMEWRDHSASTVDFKELRNSERVVCWRGREVDEQWAKSFHFIFFAHSSAEIFSLFCSQPQNASAVPHWDEDFWNSFVSFCSFLVHFASNSDGGSNFRTPSLQDSIWATRNHQWIFSFSTLQRKCVDSTTMASKVDVEGEESYHCRALLLCATTDTRARAVVQNFQEFNSLLKRDKCDDNDGEIGGCPYCISTAWRDVSSFFFYPSDQLMSSQPEVRKVIYPFQRDPPRREYEEVMNDFHENGSKKNAREGSLGSFTYPTHGRHPPLCNRCNALRLWRDCEDASQVLVLSSTFSREKFSLVAFLPRINQALSQARFLHDFSRLSRPYSVKWKGLCWNSLPLSLILFFSFTAIEYKNFFLYLYIPILQEFHPK